MASFGRKQGVAMVTNLLKPHLRPPVTSFPSGSRSINGSAAGIVSSEIFTSHTAKWMQDMSKKSPMELINEVPPLKVNGRIAACEGGIHRYQFLLLIICESVCILFMF
ncbi:unnamed protein product [Cuscuta epithymum]|uniref:Uncharacterized protein n=1 Tax=Cuscuta epithymum TaxID=186058 RepID=A0AAV0EGX4_9ASTE|nr:unnamed protein product [Cuscuta epithymum]CAH9123353.1 unnamed protein product [Cuscuta epithymum]